MSDKARRRKKIAARIVLVLACVIGTLAIFDFAYNAYAETTCFTRSTSDDGGNTDREVLNEECAVEVSRREKVLRLDATTVVVAVAFLFGSAVISRRLERRRK